MMNTLILFQKFEMFVLLGRILIETRNSFDFNYSKSLSGFQSNTKPNINDNLFMSLYDLLWTS